MAIGYGSRGEEVKALQRRLNASGANLKVDGVWGPKTQAAFEAYGTKTVNTSSNASKMNSNANAAKATYAAPKIEYMQYTPMTEAQKRSIARAQVDPAYDVQLKELEAGYAQARQDNENEALKRGMSRSSYVMDVRSALDAHKAEDKSALIGERAARIQALIAELTQKDSEKAQSARKYNNDIALQLEAMRQKQLDAQRDYEIQLQKLSASAAKKSGTSGSSVSSRRSSGRTNRTSNKSSGGTHSTPVSYYDYYSKNYLQKYGNNPAVARVLYYADRVNLQKKFGSQAVKQMDAIAEQFSKARSISAVLAR